MLSSTIPTRLDTLPEQKGLLSLAITRIETLVRILRKQGLVIRPKEEEQSLILNTGRNGIVSVLLCMAGHNRDREVYHGTRNTFA